MERVWYPGPVRPSTTQRWAECGYFSVVLSHTNGVVWFYGTLDEFAFFYNEEVGRA